MNRRSEMRTCLYLAMLLALAGMGAAPRRDAKPNIIIIIADDVGYGDVGCYGATQVKTPKIDRLAAQGLRFTDAHSTSATCTPSRYSLLTGEYAFRRKGTGILPGKRASDHRAGAEHLALSPQAGRLRHGLRRQMASRPGPRNLGLEPRDQAGAPRNRIRLLVHHPGHGRSGSLRLR
jgi:hypothetical protein